MFLAGKKVHELKMKSLEIWKREFELLQLAIHLSNNEHNNTLDVIDRRALNRVLETSCINRPDCMA